ncbi:MAG: hypothetical protein KKF41_15540 [Actinobacteria bacterium]|nr:hypothetical protein [Actinomycetota bacterium]MBU1943261.1 hypothetical protein [Actinomycetota bacterium]MBU2688990.1 hypothetical protein [Actinomycetota bacterium]
MPKRSIVLALLALTCLAVCSCGGGGTAVKDSGLELVRSYPDSAPGATTALDQGTLYKAGRINVVVLQGTYQQMGRQYGALLKDELNHDYNGMVKGLEGLEDMALEDVQEFAEDAYKDYPQKYKEIINGLAETSGLGLEKAKALNMQELYISAALGRWAREHMGKCSGLAAWGPYTSGGPLVFGRNYDLGFFNHEYVTLTVYNPIDGSLPTANLTFAGCIYVTSGMNASGVFLELNNGSGSDPSDMTASRPWAPAFLFSFLEQSTSLEQLASYFSSTTPDLAYIVQGADRESAVSFEWSTGGVKVRGPDGDGVLAATNYFVDPAWGIPPEDGVDFNVGRRENLLALAEQNKGNMTPETMMKVISTPLEPDGSGGAFRAPNLTSYEIVAQPATLTMWVRVPEYQDWVEIDLEPFFLQ